MKPNDESMAPAIEARGLCVAYGKIRVLDSIDLTLPQRVVAGLIGPNGAGKSTLLKSIVNLTPVISGKISVLGKSFASVRKQIAYVPQRSSIDWDFPICVQELVMMGTYGRLGWIRRPGRREREQVTIALERLGISHLANCQIGELSGGQQQRAFLARAIIQDASVYLLDEPFSGVDSVTEKATVELLHQMRDDGRTIVVVQHDLSTVGDYLDHVTLINRKIIASGSVDTTFTRNNIDNTYLCAAESSRVPNRIVQ